MSGSAIITYPETQKNIEAVIEKARKLHEYLKRPILIALDGRSGTGKSTIAKIIAAKVDGVEVNADNFWAGGSNAEWDARTPKEKSERAIDWRRLRGEVLEPLLAGKSTSYHPFDFVGGSGLAEQSIMVNAAPITILDGAYSARPELKDLIDLSVFVETDDDSLRRSRLIARENQDYMTDWHSRWDVAEDYYFSQVRPRSSFDMVIMNY